MKWCPATGPNATICRAGPHLFAVVCGAIAALSLSPLVAALAASSPAPAAMISTRSAFTRSRWPGPADPTRRLPCHPGMHLDSAAPGVSGRICAYAGTWRRVILGVAATLPLFITLDIVRLLVVALPDAVASPLFLVHAFYQFLLGAVLVCLAARWRYGGRAAIGHTLLA